MSMRPKPIGPIPEDTARVAKAAFPKGNLYIQIRDSFYAPVRTKAGDEPSFAGLGLVFDAVTIPETVEQFFA